MSLSDERVRQILEEHGFVCRRPKAIVRSPDLLKWEKIETIADLLFGRGNRVVLFEDETELHTNPKIQRCWMPRGEQRRILTPGKNAKVVVYGALNARNDEVVSRSAIGTTPPRSFRSLASCSAGTPDGGSTWSLTATARTRRASRSRS